MVDVANLRIDVDSRDVNQATGQLRAFVTQGQMAGNVAQKVGQQATSAFQRIGTSSRAGLAAVGRGFTSLTGGMRNFSFQMQDVAVQLSMGTDAMRVMSMQLPQLLGGAGLLGPILGGIAAAAGLLATTLFSTGQEAADLGDMLDDLAASVSDYQDAVEQARSTNAELAEDFGVLAGRARETLDALMALREVQALTALQDAGAGIADEFDKLLELPPLLVDAYRQAQAEGTQLARWQLEIIKDFENELGLTFEQADLLQQALADISAVGTVDEMVTATEQWRDRLIEVFGTADEMPKPLREVYEAVLESNLEALKLADTTGDVEAGFDRAADAAGRLEDRVRSAADLARQIAGRAEDKAMGVSLEPQKLSQGQIDSALGVKRSGGGGSKLTEEQKAHNAAVAEGKRIFEQTRTALEMFNIEEAKLNELLKAGIIDADTHARAMDQLTQAYKNAGGAAEFFGQMQMQSKDIILDSLVGITDLRTGFADLARQIARAAFQAALFGEGPMAGLFGSTPGQGLLSGLFGGGGGLGALLGFASGTNNAPGGLAVVGEEGPELMNVPAGSTVTPADQTRGMMSAMMAAPTINLKNINVLDPSLVGDFLGTEAGEQMVMNVVKKNKDALNA